MVTCPVLLFLTCFVTFISYLAIFIFVFGIFKRMNSRIIRHIKGAWDPSKSRSKQAGMDRTRSTHRKRKSNRLNTRSLGYLCEHRLRNTNTHSKSTPYSIYSHSPQYIFTKNDIKKKKKCQSPLSHHQRGNRERGARSTQRRIDL